MSSGLSKAVDQIEIGQQSRVTVHVVAAVSRDSDDTDSQTGALSGPDFKGGCPLPGGQFQALDPPQ